MKTYWVSITYACGAVSVDETGFITHKGTAPIFFWAIKKRMSFVMLKNFYIKKNQYIDSKEI